jgi:hypothetical protein
MNLDQAALSRIRRIHTIVQASVIVCIIWVLFVYSDEWVRQGRSQQEFRKQFHTHLVDLTRGQGSLEEHAEFYQRGSKAQIELDGAFGRMMALMSLLVLSWIGMGAMLHRRSSLALEGMPEKAGGLRVLSTLGWLWTFGLVALSVGAFAGSAVTLSNWKSLDTSDLSKAFPHALAATQTVKAIYSAWMTCLFLSFIHGLILYIYGVRMVLAANQEARLRKFERDIVGGP